ncbi:hypothetical protein OIU78_027742 [Salix suchowensis]|nr:hypothetical protein OIU78_027742 [Salix suchowensis]
MGKYAAEQLILSEPEKPSPYILLANIYSSKGRWKERAKTIKRMKEMCVAKETGISWIEIENNLHSFAVEDKMHPQAEIIYGVLAGLYWHMIDEVLYLQFLHFKKPLQSPINCHNFPSKTNPLRLFPSLSTSSKFKLHCLGRAEEDSPLSTSSAYTVLGIEPGCSSAAIKAAFRAKVKQFHPDLNKDGKVSDLMIRRIIQAYEMLSNLSRSEIIERECLDPFEDPECEAFDIFVNEVLCVGKGCPYSCVQRAPHAFTYASSTGTARATSQGHGEDYQVQLAVGQCPRSCIHYVTPSQRVILEEFLDSERGRNLTQQELEIATNVFNDANLLGRGNFESIYKACIGDSISCVAVKEHHLYPSESKGENCRLTLKERLGIAMHIADDLEYLHVGCSTQVLHCDLKPQNVVLDDDMVAHVPHFGIGKLIFADKPTEYSATTSVCYIPPEYGESTEV